MKKSTDLRTGRNCVFAMHVHLVFVTKYRKKIFTKDVMNKLIPIFQSVAKDFEVDLIEVNGEEDHVHLSISYPPKVSIAKLVNSLKGVSSRLIRKEQIPVIQKALWGNKLWSPSYFAASCGGAPLDIIKHYIQSQ